METILLKAFTFVALIVLGYALKKIRYFSTVDFSSVSRIVLGITLPCAVITNFSTMQIQVSLLLLVLLGLGLDLFLSWIGFLWKKRESREEAAFHVINLSGFNIGSFGMPFVQNFLGAGGIVPVCIFDVGNAIMCTGATYTLAATVLKSGEKQTLGSFLKNLVSSVPLDTYVIMLILTLCRVRLPDFVLQITSLAGSANPFLCMLMIGIGFEFHLNKRYIRRVFSILAVRYFLAIALAAVFYLFLPMPQESRLAVALVMLTPISACGPAFSYRLGLDVELSSAVNSLGILISLVLMTGMMLLFGV